MARPQGVNDEELLQRLARVFRDVGYEGASLALLSQAAGLQKASLYHRFPGGKQQMADEVLKAALAWYGENILQRLHGDGAPAERLALVARQLNAYYSGGRQACLLNVLASPPMQHGPSSDAIKGAFQALIAAFAHLAEDAGFDPATARRRAERSVMGFHGSLVLSRGLGSPRPFANFLVSLADELIGGAPVQKGSIR